MSKWVRVATLFTVVCVTIAPGSSPAQAKCLPGAMEVPALDSVVMPERFTPGEPGLVIVRARLDAVRGDDNQCELTRGCPLDEGRVEVLADSPPTPPHESQHLVFAAEPTGEPGVYQTTVTLPFDATWWIRVSVGSRGAASVVPLAEAPERGIPVARYSTMSSSTPTSATDAFRDTLSLCGERAAAARRGLWWLGLAGGGIGAALVVRHRRRFRVLI